MKFRKRLGLSHLAKVDVSGFSIVVQHLVEETEAHQRAALPDEAAVLRALLRILREELYFRDRELSKIIEQRIADQGG